ncbi:VOC family protein [Bacillus sp. T33-2]|uniref:VOC family protein n=1 Tax=Bacillus sp. T33-2 TaxID=2054168 RepID=UPI000C75E370|nr:VOC family protein [Bacillus sp. T33-2]PLR89153.1 glyoxalase/bleomycin resistance/dioxygenase family protein [Bacillus sp. T33-2]
MRIHHFALEACDMERTKSFYERVLGFTEECRLRYLGSELIFLTLNGIRLELLPQTEEKKNTTGSHLCFEVDDLQEIITRMAANHIVICEGPLTLENGWKTVFYEGPENEIIEFMQPQ